MLIFEVVLVDVDVKGGKVFDGEFVFKLYDIYGFLLDLMVDVCCECGMMVDELVFDDVMVC